MALQYKLYMRGLKFFCLSLSHGCVMSLKMVHCSIGALGPRQTTLHTLKPFFFFILFVLFFFVLFFPLYVID